MRPGRALVTGAGARLGQAMAIALGEAGWQVAVHYRGSAAGAHDTVTEIRVAGGRAEAVQADLSDEADTASLVAQAAAASMRALIKEIQEIYDDAAAEELADRGGSEHGAAQAQYALDAAQKMLANWETKMRSL